MRKRSIVEQAARIAADNGGVPVIDEDLLEEITFIVEWPTGFAGKFDAHYLEMPEPCVVTPMQDHQRYFPVKSEGRLLPLFIAFRNGGDEFIDNVRAGNERVLEGTSGAHAQVLTYDEDSDQIPCRQGGQGAFRRHVPGKAGKHVGQKR